MNPTGRSLQHSRAAILVAMLAVIASICALCFAGVGHNAWADTNEETLFEKAISKLPFEKTDKGITVKVDYDESEDAVAADSESKTSSSSKADSNSDADSSESKSGNDSDSSSASKSEDSNADSSSSNSAEASKPVVVKISVDEDTAATKVVVKADDKEITKEVPGKMLEEDDPFEFTLEDCDSISKLTIYGPKDEQKDESSTNDDSNANDEGDTSDESSNDANDETPASTENDTDDDAVTIEEESSDDNETDGISIVPLDEENNADSTEANVESAENETDDTEANAESTESNTDDAEASTGDANGTEASTGDTDGTEATAENEGDASTTEGDSDGFFVTLDNNGHGKIDGSVKKLPVKAGETLDLSTAYIGNDGRFFFDGWYTDKNCTQAYSSDMPINENITVYAKWIETCTVTFVEKSRAPLGTVIVPKGMTVHGGAASEPNITKEFNNPSAEGWIFEGWFTEDDTPFDLDTTPVTKDMTVTAIWSQDCGMDTFMYIDASVNQVITINENEATTATDTTEIDAQKEAEQAQKDGTFNLIVTKVSNEDGASLEGAEFTLKDSNGTEIGSWTSGKSGVQIKKLKRDTTYVLYETKAPDGYGVEKPININFALEEGKPIVMIDQGSKPIALTKNSDGVALLNVKDSAGSKKTTSTTMPLTGDNQNLPLAGICFGAAAVVTAGIAFAAYRKRKAA